MYYTMKALYSVIISTKRNNEKKALLRGSWKTVTKERGDTVSVILSDQTAGYCLLPG